MNFARLLCSVALLLNAALAHAQGFKIADIRINGLQRVSAGSVFGALPLNVGEQVDDQQLVESTRALFKTGFFQDIQLGRDGDVLDRSMASGFVAARVVSRAGGLTRIRVESRGPSTFSRTTWGRSPSSTWRSPRTTTGWLARPSDSTSRARPRSVLGSATWSGRTSLTTTGARVISSKAR